MSFAQAGNFGNDRPRQFPHTSGRATCISEKIRQVRQPSGGIISWAVGAGF